MYEWAGKIKLLTLVFRNLQKVQRLLFGIPTMVNIYETNLSRSSAPIMIYQLWESVSLVLI